MKRIPLGCLALLAAVSTAPATAEVVDSAAHGFTVANRAEIAAPPQRVWQALTSEIASWWHPEHTFSGDSANLSIDLAGGGCFCERLANGGIVQHLAVIHVVPGRLLRMSGGLGPLQGLGAAGTLDVRLAPEGSGTTVTWTYAVGGYVAGGLDAWAGPVDGVLAQQLERLARWLETGSPGG